MKLCKNYLFGVMSTNWSIKRIQSALGVNSTMARMYFQPCTNADQVNELLCAIAQLAD